ncbi:Hypothetical protein ORPV_960 [Orpheovirus IHUMI-LCC2]|uniref:Uncharacterized protein n=1 Tax=Orpheovirus IHUMI-LCC2 TaxID=2023057 RepID=A0A2I2L5Q0_9VIRU|nr:Hypothetical protein ORPV_960 [Orpheovirus IHUMI-LCC2]SNW62864.1 Hypothetical protein ORPV_960 [Orpheovirus IHUMI-LCC2]
MENRSIRCEVEENMKNNMKISTMVFVAELEGDVNTYSSFAFLPITVIDIKPTTKKTKKIKIPHCDKVGAILSMCMKGQVRGILKSLDSKGFKNSVSIDISTSRKNLNIKLSKNSMHITGALSEDDAQEGCALLIKNILYTRDLVNKMRNNLEEVETICNWFVENSRGTQFEKEEIIEQENACYHIRSTDWNIKYPDADKYCSFVENHDNDIVLFFVRTLVEAVMEGLNLSHFERMLGHIKNIMKIPESDYEGPIISSDNLRVSSMKCSMIKYDYKLPYDVDVQKLCVAINGYNGFIARHNNQVRLSARIILPYDPEGIENIHVKKNQNAKHTFIVNGCGSVSQHSPCHSLGCDAYKMFMEALLDLKEFIESPEDDDITSQS